MLKIFFFLMDYVLKARDWWDGATSDWPTVGNVTGRCKAEGLWVHSGQVLEANAQLVKSHWFVHRHEASLFQAPPSPALSSCDCWSFDGARCIEWLQGEDHTVPRQLSDRERLTMCRNSLYHYHRNLSAALSEAPSRGWQQADAQTLNYVRGKEAPVRYHWQEHLGGPKRAPQRFGSLATTT